MCGYAAATDAPVLGVFKAALGQLSPLVGVVPPQPSHTKIGRNVRGGRKFFQGESVSTVGGVSTIAPGWYPDPENSARSRWWDGAQWTAATSEPQPVAPQEAFVQRPAPVPQPHFEQLPFVPREKAEPSAPADRPTFAPQQTELQVFGQSQAPTSGPLTRRQLRELSAAPAPSTPAVPDNLVERSAPSAPEAAAPQSNGPTEVAQRAASPATPPVSGAASSQMAIYQEPPMPKVNPYSAPPEGSTMVTGVAAPASPFAAGGAYASAPPPPVAADVATSPRLAVSAPVVAQAPAATPPYATVSSQPAAPASAPQQAAQPAAPAPAAPQAAPAIDPFLASLGAVAPRPQLDAAPVSGETGSFDSLVDGRGRMGESVAPAPAASSSKLSVNTPAIWLFALLPILTTAAIAVAYFVLGYFPDIPWWAALGGPISLYLLLARSDQKKLETIGHSRLTSPFWALLPLVFLIIRTVRLGKRALAPLLVSILGGVVMAAATVLVVLPMLALAAVG